MIQNYKLYLPLSKRYIDIDVYIPDVKCDKFETLYLLDGQNAFLDSKAAFGRAIRANNHIDYASKNLNKNIIGVAIYNSGSDMGRVNEYSPFKVKRKKWSNNNPLECINYCEDFINTIIPFIDNNYNTYTDKSHRYIYGSSLAAITALYLGFKYDSFEYIGSFSTATFLFEDDLYKFLDSNINKKRNVFLYVGKNETSDRIPDKNLYYNCSLKLQNYFIDNNINSKLVYSLNGRHNEETWDKFFIDFIDYINKK